MTTETLDIVGIGNAIVDVLSQVEDEYLVRHGLEKSSMSLIDAEQSDRMYESMEERIEVSGGSAANTIVGVVSFGGNGAFIGKVYDDNLGRTFSDDLRAAGVLFDTPMAVEGPSTARCLVNVTKDANRTMATYLGASVGLRSEDVNVDTIASAKITYLEGYLWDPPSAKEAFRKAMGIAHGAKRKVALSLSDSFCVERYRAEFRDLVRNGVDIVFANENELLALYEVSEICEAIKLIAKECPISAITLGERGSIINVGGETITISPELPAKLVDTTGAGDLYAAGFLYGCSQGMEWQACGRLGSLAASEVISHFGARPQCEFSTFVS